MCERPGDIWGKLQRHNASPLQELLLAECRAAGVRLWVKRDDLLRMPGSDADSAFCGNKWRKLKYNLLGAADEGIETLITFGGAYSNHLAAVAEAGFLFGLHTFGIVRGERVEPLNPTLDRAAAQGMCLHHLSRTAYRVKADHPEVRAILEQYPNALVLPEGGTNAAALTGCAEIAAEIQDQLGGQPDIVAVACGTGGTAAGLINAFPPEVEVRVFPALKGNFVEDMIKDLLPPDASSHWTVAHDYHFGGYARYRPELMDFMSAFFRRTGIRLDPVYTGKLFYGLLDQIRKEKMNIGAKIVVIHSGGLQGVAGFRSRFGPLLI